MAVVKRHREAAREIQGEATGEDRTKAGTRVCGYVIANLQREMLDTQPFLARVMQDVVLVCLYFFFLVEFHAS